MMTGIDDRIHLSFSYLGESAEACENGIQFALSEAKSARVIAYTGTLKNRKGD